MYHTGKLSKFTIYLLSKIKLILTKIKTKALPGNIILTPKEKFTIEEIEDSYKFFKKFFYKSIFKEQIELQHYIAKLVAQENSGIANPAGNSLCLEFGVFKGSSINIFSSYLKNINYEIYGFDSFEGINEDWYGTSKTKKSFNNFGQIPNVNKNVIIIKGLIQNTLCEFLKKNKEKKIVFVHMDLDTYESSRFVLQQIKPYLSRSCIILFDEIYNVPGWSVGEYKALTDNFKESEYSFFAFSSNGSGAAIRIN